MCSECMIAQCTYVCKRARAEVTLLIKKHFFGKDSSKKVWASSRIFSIRSATDHHPLAPLCIFLYSFFGRGM
jgi:hypothetical protein